MRDFADRTWCTDPHSAAWRDAETRTLPDAYWRARAAAWRLLTGIKLPSTPISTAHPGGARFQRGLK